MSTASTTRRGLAPALFLALALGACDDAVTTPDSGTAIDFELGVELQLSDTAVVVDGTPRAGLSHPNRGLRVYHTTLYEYGGLGSYAPDRVWEEQWFSRFGYQLEPVERGDTVVYEYLDFGDVSMAEETLLKATDIPDVSNAPYPIEFVNYVVYLATQFAWRQELNGAAITFVEAPYLERMARGDEIAFQGTGGPRTASFQATFALEPLPTLIGMDNGANLAFRSQRPVIDADRDLGLTFDGIVDPETAIFVLFPWPEDLTDPARRRAATLVGQLRTATGRAVIPARVLRQLLDAAGVEEAGFVLYVLRFLETGDVIGVHRLDTDTDLALGVGQIDETRVLVRLIR